MKSLVEFILESKQQIDNIIKAVESKNVDEIEYSIVRYVDSNDNIDSEDTDDLEAGVFIGYLKTKKEWNSCAIVLKQPKSQYSKWLCMFVSESGKIEYSKEIKLHSEIFGKSWKISYIEHIPDKLEKIFLDNIK